MMETILQIMDLSRKYTAGDTDIWALKNVSFSIEKGALAAITGQSGSGKSTLMHILGCLDTPTVGTYTLDGIDIKGTTSSQRAALRNQKIGFVFQKFHLIPGLTACDNVALPHLYAGASQSAARKKACLLLDRVELSSRADHYPYQLSGGQQQRVAIARALVNNPSIILADEPTGNLDTQTGNTILNLLKELNAQGTTIILVTHEPSIATQTNRIIQLRDGTVVHDSAKLIASKNQP